MNASFGSDKLHVKRYHPNQGKTKEIYYKLNSCILQHKVTVVGVYDILEDDSGYQRFFFFFTTIKTYINKHRSNIRGTWWNQNIEDLVTKQKQQHKLIVKHKNRNRPKNPKGSTNEAKRDTWNDNKQIQAWKFINEVKQDINKSK